MSELQTVERAPLPPARPTDAHKGTFGTVIVVGGCETMMGAPALCAMAALRSGVGLAKIATSADVLATALAIEPGATGILFGDDTATNLHLLDRADADGSAVLAVGPGMGQSEGAAELIDALLRGQRPVVLDADGLNLLAKSKLATGMASNDRGGGPTAGRCLVLTPHPGEFRRLATPLGIEQSATDPSTRPAAAAALAKAHGAVVVLKGAGTVVTDGQRVYTNTTGNPALATAGSGDVLTGLIAALIAQHLSPFDAAALGADLHGLAGDLWAAEQGPSGLTARDLADRLPRAFQRRRRRG